MRINSVLYLPTCLGLGAGSDQHAPVVDEETSGLRVDSWSDKVSNNENAAAEAASAWFEALEPTSADEESSLDSASISDEETDTNSTSSIREVMKHTDDTLDQLIRLGVAIRKSGTNARLRKADSSFNQGDHKDLQQYLTLNLLVEASKQQANEMKNTEERIIDPAQSYDRLSPEQQHLIIANLRRRHRFLYARRHQKKLKGPLDINLVHETKRAAQFVEAPKSAAPGHPTKTSKGKPDVYETPHDSGMTVTTASAVEDDVLNTVATPSQAASRVSVTTARMDYPSPPPARDGMRSFKCPCCYQTLPVMFRERSRWRYNTL